MKVIVNVTRNDIEKGAIGSASRCPVALASKRHLKPKFSPSVWNSVSVSGPRTFVTIPTPPSVAVFTLAFDMCRPVKPFRFTLDIPAKYLRRKP